jgi:4-hydroxy-tetrahydrodipicolinate synthase
MSLNLSGYLSALPTPFRDGELDEAAFARHCEWQIAEGIAGLVVCGTTGEAPTLAPNEQSRLVRLAVEVAAGRVPVVAGAGSNATTHAVALARAAEVAGADALLAVVPYYNKPSQEGMYRHFRAIHDAAGLPLILYDVPARTGCGLGLDTIERLAALPRTRGLKDATGDLARPIRLRRALGETFGLFSGDDATALGFLAAGGDGCISVVSNLVPSLCVGMDAAWRSREIGAAQAIAWALDPLIRALFLEGNPVPLKYALHALGRMSAELRLPLCPAMPETRRAVEAALAELSASVATLAAAAPLAAVAA